MPIEREKFPLLRIKEGDRFTQIRRLSCSRCDAHQDISAGTLNSEHVAKRYRELGWDVDYRHIGRAACPACAARKKETNAVSTHQKPAPEPERAPTPDQRAAIRRLLDTHFDDKVGGYLEGYSDQRIGKELNLPWSWVGQLREAAYGPIRVDPVTAELRERLLKAEAALGDLEARFTREITEARARVNAIKVEIDRIGMVRAS